MEKAGINLNISCISERIICLPRRLAVLFGPTQTVGTVLLPEVIQEKWREMEKPPFSLVKGIVVSVGRGVDVPIGAFVWALPKAGLIVESNDIDLPQLGASVPDGHTLRFFGVGDTLSDQVLGWEPSDLNKEGTCR